MLPEAVLVIGAVPTAKYGLPSTMEIPDSIREFIKNSDVILLANHGALTLGSDLLMLIIKWKRLNILRVLSGMPYNWAMLMCCRKMKEIGLMDLRDKFNLPGRVATCDATPMPSSSNSLEEVSQSGNTKVNEQMIREIAEKVIAKTQKKLKPYYRNTDI